MSSLTGSALKAELKEFVIEMADELIRDLRKKEESTNKKSYVQS